MTETLFLARQAWSERRNPDALRLLDPYGTNGPLDPVRFPGDEIVKATYLLAVVCRELGDTAAATKALDALDQALEAHPRLKPLLYGPSLYTRAQLAYHRDDPIEAMRLYRLAIEEFRRESMPDYLRRATQNLAWILVDLNECDEARTLLNDALTLTTPTDLAYHTIVLAHLAAHEGRYGEAITMCHEILGGSGVDDDIVVLVDAVMSCAAMKLEKYELAWSVAVQGVEFAQTRNLDHVVYLVIYRQLNAIRAIRGALGA